MDPITTNVKIRPAQDVLARDLDAIKLKFNAWIETMTGGKALMPQEITRSCHWKHIRAEIEAAGYKLYYYDDECIAGKADRWEISW